MNPFEGQRELRELNKETIQTQKKIDHYERLKTYNGPDRVVYSLDMADHIYNLSKDQTEVSLRSNIPALDNYIQAFYGGELNVLSGETGNGKTLLAQSLTYQFSRQEEKSLWFTYEVRPEQFLKQFSEPLPIFLIPMELKTKSLLWLEERILEAKLKYGTSSVFVDHLHFLVDLKRGNNMSIEIGFVMRELKRMALKYNLCFFLLAHTNRLKLEGEPDVDSLRDSSLVGCEADNVFFIWRLRNTETQAILKIAKNRRNGVFGKKIKLQKQGKYLVEIAHDENYQDT